MKRLLLTAVLAMILTTPVMAQDTPPADQYNPADPAYNNWYMIVSDADAAAAAGFTKAGEQHDAGDVASMCASLKGVQTNVITEIDALNHMTAIIKSDATITSKQFAEESGMINETMESIHKAGDIADGAIADNCQA